MPSRLEEPWLESLLVSGSQRSKSQLRIDSFRTLYDWSWPLRVACCSVGTNYYFLRFGFSAGLSGGQRKLLLFELICQRTTNQSNLLLVLDKPFSGVTDDFVPFIVDRLHELRRHHNVLLVTNDHVEALKSMADNTIVVSATDRSTVQVNGLTKVVRDKVILALCVGDSFAHETSSDNLKFFFDVEVNNSAVAGMAIFTVFLFTLFLVTFWNSGREFGAMVIVAASIVSFFSINPYLLALGDWRNHMQEEAEALLHSSIRLNNTLKSLLTLVLVTMVSLVEWGVVNAVIDGFEGGKFWWGMLMDSASVTIPFIFFGLYTQLPFQAVQILSRLPFLCMIFFSTTFSPGSGLEGLKALRYLFARCVHGKSYLLSSHVPSNCSLRECQVLLLVHDTCHCQGNGRLSG
jgi:energy-coupling factor transporter ATP-binding protein EcfA2